MSSRFKPIEEEAQKYYECVLGSEIELLYSRLEGGDIHALSSARSWVLFVERGAVSKYYLRLPLNEKDPFKSKENSFRLVVERNARGDMDDIRFEYTDGTARWTAVPEQDEDQAECFAGWIGCYAE